MIPCTQLSFLSQLSIWMFSQFKMLKVWDRLPFVQLNWTFNMINCGKLSWRNSILTIFTNTWTMSKLSNFSTLLYNKELSSVTLLLLSCQLLSPNKKLTINTSPNSFVSLTRPMLFLKKKVPKSYKSLKPTSKSHDTNKNDTHFDRI